MCIHLRRSAAQQTDSATKMNTKQFHQMNKHRNNPNNNRKLQIKLAISLQLFMRSSCTVPTSTSYLPLAFGFLCQNCKHLIPIENIRIHYARQSFRFLLICLNCYAYSKLRLSAISQCHPSSNKQLRFAFPFAFVWCVLFPLSDGLQLLATEHNCKCALISREQSFSSFKPNRAVLTNIWQHGLIPESYLLRKHSLQSMSKRKQLHRLFAFWNNALKNVFNRIIGTEFHPLPIMCMKLRSR